MALIKYIDEKIIKDLYSQGLTTSEVAKILDISAATASYWKKKLGFELNNKLIDYKEVQKQYDSGLTIREVCKSCNISKGALDKAKIRGDFKTRNISLANTLSKQLKPHLRRTHYKSGSYDDIYFDSSWELAYYLYNKEVNGVLLKRSNIILEYDDGDKKRHYIPDFIDDNGLLHEVKGSLFRSKDKIKYETFKNKVKYIFDIDMVEILNYVVNKYGIDFHKVLYK